MDKILWIFLSIFTILSLSFICYFYYYLFKQYEKATINYYKKISGLRQYRIIEKQTKQNSQIKDNLTKVIDPDIINRMVGYSLLKFLDEHNSIYKTYKIKKAKYKIGRETSNDLILQDRTVSKQQCLIITQSGKFFIRNLSESCPTKVNGVSVKNSKQIKFGDIIKIANYTIRFCDITEQNPAE